MSSNADRESKFQRERVTREDGRLKIVTKGGGLEDFKWVVESPEVRREYAKKWVVVHNKKIYLSDGSRKVVEDELPALAESIDLYPIDFMVAYIKGPGELAYVF